MNYGVEEWNSSPAKKLHDLPLDYVLWTIDYGEPHSLARLDCIF